METPEKFTDSNFMLQHSPAVTYVCKAHGDFGAVFITDNIQQQIGYTPEEFINNSSFWIDHIHPDDREEVFANLEQLFESGSHVHEYRFRHADGHYVWMRDELKLINDELGKPSHMIGYWINISRRKEAEKALEKLNNELELKCNQRSQELADLQKQLLQTQKMDAIGQLTGGIAHDFNNMLTAINGFAELALMRFTHLDDSGSLDRYLNQIMLTGQRGRELVKQMLAFSRGESGNPIPVEVGHCVEESIGILRATLPTSIQILLHVHDWEQKILIDPTQLHQLVMNLVINARDAIGKKVGKIDICISPVTMKTAVCDSCYQDFHGDFICIEVKDNGAGIQNCNARNRIFDPFFSTKELSKGSGMGLSVVHGVVHANHGHITVSSEKGKGSSFKICFPESFQEQQVRQKSDHDVIHSHCHGTILVVEDDENVLMLMEELLNVQGYEAIPFSDPLKALDYYKIHHGRIDLMITDQTMPGMLGKDLSVEVLKINPTLPIILATGYREGVSDDKVREIGIARVVDKPITNADTLNLIIELMQK